MTPDPPEVTQEEVEQTEEAPAEKTVSDHLRDSAAALREAAQKLLEIEGRKKAQG